MWRPCWQRAPALSRDQADGRRQFGLHAGRRRHLKQLDDFYLMMIEQPLGARRHHRPRRIAGQARHAHLPGRVHPLGASCRAGHPAGRLRHHQHQAGARGRLPRSPARARRGAGRRHSRVVRRDAGSRHGPRAQHRARHAAEFRPAGRRFGQPALLGARHRRCRRWKSPPHGTIRVSDEPGFGYALDLDFIRRITVREESLG